MVQKKAHEVDGWLARPDPAIRIVLVYGPDHGLVAERANAYARSTGVDSQDPFSVVRLDASALDGDPGRLVDEANTISMFGGERLIWVRHASAQKGLGDVVAQLCGKHPRDARILIEAGDLKKGVALRTVVEAAAAAIALPCYADEKRDLDRLIDEVFGPAGLTVSSDARRLLQTLLGGDRLASRGELEKLALYAGGKGELGIEDVRLLTGDAGTVSVDSAIDAALIGDIPALDAALSRMTANGTPIFQLLSGALRLVQQIQLMRDSVDRGMPPSQVVGSARPPIFMARRRAVETALARFDQTTLAGMLARIQRAVLETRKSPRLAIALSRDLMTWLAIESRRRVR